MAIDFQFDQTADGHNLKLSYVVDEFTREARAIECRRGIDADHTVKVLDRLAGERGIAPAFLRCDNGPEMTANALRDGAAFRGPGARTSSRGRRGLSAPVLAASGARELPLDRTRDGSWCASELAIELPPFLKLVHTRSFPSGVFRSLTWCRGLGFLLRSWSSRSGSRPRRRAGSICSGRWPDGFRCRRCGGREVGVMHARRRVWQCKRCGGQTSVTAGTLMHDTQTPLRLWFWAVYLVATHHSGISAVQLQRQLGISRHERAWMMLHKLRRAMVAPERELLKREVEVDEFFLGGYQEGLKGGRARGKKVMCGVAVEVRGRGSGRLRLAVLENASGASLGAFLQATTEPGAVVHTDAWPGYHGLAALRYEHSPMSQNAGAGEQPYLPRAHRAISNLKAWLHGTHRRASRGHLQAYLDEFVFRHNRRGNPHAAFQTLLGLGTHHQPASYRNIIDEAA